jgi:hypothetical protein
MGKGVENQGDHTEKDICTVRNIIFQGKVKKKN